MNETIILSIAQPNMSG